MNSDAYTAGVTFGKNTNITVDEDGNIYVVDGNEANSGLWVTNPNELSFFQFYAGARTKGVLYQNGVEVAGIPSSAYICGEGVDKKVYAYQKNSAGKFVINVYNVGQVDGSYVTYWSEAPSKTIALPSGMVADATIVVVEQGVWVGQTKTSVGNSETSPALMFIDNEGNITFNSGVEANKAVIESVSGSAIAVTKDEKMLVANDEDGFFQFFDVT